MLFRLVPLPEPGPGQVLVSVAAAGLNFADTLLIGGPWFKVGGKRMAENVFAILETFGR